MLRGHRLTIDLMASADIIPHLRSPVGPVRGRHSRGLGDARAAGRGQHRGPGARRGRARAGVPPHIHDRPRLPQGQ